MATDPTPAVIVANEPAATTTASATGLFSSELISASVAEELPAGYKIRALGRGDYATGFLDCLRVLTTVGDISEEQFSARYDWLQGQDGGYFILVIEDDASRVVGTGALVVERKL